VLSVLKRSKVSIKNCRKNIFQAQTVVPTVFWISMQVEWKFLYIKIHLLKKTDKCKDMMCSQIGRINIVRMSMLLKVIYRFMKIPMKIPVTLFTEIEITILKFIWNHKRSPKQFFRKENKAGSIIFQNRLQSHSNSNSTGLGT
jgi:hypothetical protein